MKRVPRIATSAALLAAGTLFLTSCGNDPVTNLNAARIDPYRLAAESRTSLENLYRINPTARQLGSNAEGILVFPRVTRGGFMFGGMGGNGALIQRDGTIRQFYQTTGMSYGLQAGLQRYGYALFFMDSSALQELDRKDGWEIATTPNIVIVDRAAAATLSTTTMDRSTYAFFFDQRGLMGGIDIQGSKITRLHLP